MIFCVLLIFIGTATYANEIYHYLAEPLLQHMPKNSSMIAIDVASPFFTPFKLAFVVAVFISVPFILYQFWGFVAPGLYRHEKVMIAPLLLASTLLFYGGAAFAYFLVFPLVFGYLTAAAPEGVAVMTDIATYLDFVLGMFFAFGVAFEIPIFTIVLVWTGIISPQSLAEKRPYVIVGVFVIAMFLTPPDALSQTLLAVPMWMLFEAGLLFSRLFVNKSDDE
jgi:sec-independent protein translocase protein TatC